MVVFLLLSWIEREFNSWAASITYVSFFFNRWMIVSARNLYWVVGTFFLPFLGMLFLSELDEKKQVKLWVFPVVAFITVFCAWRADLKWCPA